MDNPPSSQERANHAFADLYLKGIRSVAVITFGQCAFVSHTNRQFSLQSPKTGCLLNNIAISKSRGTKSVWLCVLDLITLFCQPDERDDMPRVMLIVSLELFRCN